MTINLDLGGIAASVIVAAVLFLGSMLFKHNRTLDRLTHVLESIQPAGVLPRLDDVEEELRELREWALPRGYERRHGERRQDRQARQDPSE